jgi:branched-chain amino acid transport system ATP-binding protein
MSALLEIDALETAYGASQVLFGIDLRIAAGEVATLLGRNGMGKTTTVRSICGLERPLRGRIRFEGKDITGWTADRIGRAGIALVPEGRQIFPNLTVRENLIAFAANRHGARDPWTLDRVITFFPILAERAKNLGGRLSGGEQQMLTLCRTLMGDPDLIIIDEPTEGLAPKIVELVGQYLQTIKARGISVLLIEQKLTIAMTISDRTLVMGHGSIVFQGTPETLRADNYVRKEWLEV